MNRQFLYAAWILLIGAGASSIAHDTVGVITFAGLALDCAILSLVLAGRDRDSYS